MSDPRSLAAVQAIDRKIKTVVAPIRAWRAEGRAVSNGRAVIRQNGETADDAETYPILVPAAPTPGFDSVMLPTDGASVHLGVLLQGSSDALVFGIGQTRIFGDDQEAADNPSTTNNAQTSGGLVSVMALTWNSSSPVPLPDGVYDFTVDGSFLAGHSAGDHVQFNVVAGGVQGHLLSLPATSSITTRLRSVRSTFTTVTVSGGIVFGLQYRRDDALTGETASARNPALLIFATRRG